MLRFLLAVMLIAVLLKIGQDNAYIGFGAWLFLALAFMIYTTNSVDCEDIEYERKMLRTSKGRRQYYRMINSQ